MSALCITLSVEVEIPDAGDAYMDVLAEDITDEVNLNHLRRDIRKWAQLASGLPCHVEVTED